VVVCFSFEIGSTIKANDHNPRRDASRFTRRLRATVAGLAAAVLAVTPSAGAQREASAHAARGSGSTCDRVAAPNGSDAARGTLRRPFRTVQRLVNALRPGQAGCLLAGTYVGNVRIGRGGARGARLTLAPYPGQHAEIFGRLAIMRGADYVTVRGLSLDGANAARLPSPTIDADHDTFSHDDVTNDHTGICFEIGSRTWGWASGTLITHSRVHDCGQMTRADNYQHGFYVVAATGTEIAWNLIYDNAARGIQLYPDAQYTTIDHNIIDGNGEGIIVSGEDGMASSHTNIYFNIVSNSRVRHNIESWWPRGNPVGVHNLVHDNCLWRGREGGISGGGLRTLHNAHVNPMFVNPAGHDYRLKPASPCLFAVGDVEAAVDGTVATIPLVKHAPFGAVPVLKSHETARDGRRAVS
jgi:Right handed beta helix region